MRIGIQGRCLGLYLKLRPYRQTSVNYRGNVKLAPHFDGPYRKILRVGTIAYKLELPKGELIYSVFHVSQLRKQIKSIWPTSSSLLGITEDSTLVVELAIISTFRWVKLGRRQVKLLVLWSTLPREDATWENFEGLKQKFPEMKSLRTKVHLEEDDSSPQRLVWGRT